MFFQVAATRLWIPEPVDYPCCNDSVLYSAIHFGFEITHKMQVMPDISVAIDKVLLKWVTWIG